MAQSSKEHPKEAQRLSDLNRSKHIHSTGAFHVESTYTTIHDRFATRDKIEQRLRNEEITVLYDNKHECFYSGREFTYFEIRQVFNGLTYYSDCD
ncbi:hypothetical protein Pyn_22858 [Prunus yedoensis var. nudiflora]|uniref:Uncharacterized protein n=1 Tax=Prunus yedoensis var. nudiflora TaxID=2094558 RepID=A0A314YJW2_PRUYE|nr:hypothetical protein Pyn_22858 [Prunus yedoensis var. nudiflora]